jgi:hypothetical protein
MALLARGAEMRVLKSLAFVVVGAVAGIVAALLMLSGEDWAGLPPARFTPTALGFLGVGMLIGALAGGHVAYRLFWKGCKTERHTPLSSDAERDARAKFQPTSSNESDDAIQPDKQNVKPGDC